MASIVHQKVKGTTYLYESVGYRDKNDGGKVKNVRTPVGRIDRVTGEPIYKAEYVERMKSAGTPVAISETQKLFSIGDVKNSTVKDYGLFFLLNNIAERLGLIDALKASSPCFWKEIYTIAEYLLSAGEPFMYCQDWLDGRVSLDCASLSSQRISELMEVIPFDERMNFYKNWCAKVSENDYLALDITSISSYSELIPDAEWGYNRDGDDLPQINLCMLMGEKSRLPVYQEIYSGSLSDVSTLQTTIDKFDAITGGKPVTSVMDKGFFSMKNVKAMLAKDGQKFLIAVPFSSKFAKEQVDSVRGAIDCYKNAILIGGDALRGMSKSAVYCGFELTAHIFFNPSAAASARDKIYATVKEMEQIATLDPDKYASDKKYKKYLDINENNGVYTVSARENAVESALQYAGWLVIITNRDLTAEQAIGVYRAKDVVEKGFENLKHALDLGRLRSHSSETAQNKVFVGFIALVLLSEISRVMSEKKLYKNFTLKQLMRTMSKLKIQSVGGRQILFPITKQQRAILAAFGIKESLLV